MESTKTSYRLRLPGNPGLAKKNKPKIRCRNPHVKCRACGKPLAHPYVAPGDHREGFAKAVGRLAKDVPEPLAGPVLLSVVAQWPSKREKDGPAKGRPFGDADACVAAVMDVLAEAGVYGNDGQVAVVIGVSAYAGARQKGELSILARRLEQTDLEDLGELLGEPLAQLQVMVGCSGLVPNPVEEPARRRRGGSTRR